MFGVAYAFFEEMHSRDVHFDAKAITRQNNAWKIERGHWLLESTKMNEIDARSIGKMHSSWILIEYVFSGKINSLQ